jgi:F0F1-type ATP synthase assembly protein I
MVLSVGLVFQLGGMIACLVLGFLFLGLWLDRHLGTTPWMMLVLMVVGLLVAVVSTYRVVALYRNEQ